MPVNNAGMCMRYSLQTSNFI